MYNTTKEKLEYNVEDLRGIAGKLQRDESRMTVLAMIQAIESVAFSLERISKDLPDD